MTLAASHTLQSAPPGVAVLPASRWRSVSSAARLDDVCLQLASSRAVALLVVPTRTEASRSSETRRLPCWFVQVPQSPADDVERSPARLSRVPPFVVIELRPARESCVSNQSIHEFDSSRRPAAEEHRRVPCRRSRLRSTSSTSSCGRKRLSADAYTARAPSIERLLTTGLEQHSCRRGDSLRALLPAAATAGRRLRRHDALFGRGQGGGGDVDLFSSSS